MTRGQGSPADRNASALQAGMRADYRQECARIAGRATGGASLADRAGTERGLS
ncbi:hypothetical protein [Treponema endosymbiont of Eucomonympha sp.]|uniref:hypothetical protein n=1 Tax=Treponema endosymbiont of Eucomonympha sp. TaxID=1580831 RepID=UPI000AEC2D17|nr:hypothetical protein [Treponema endosymbiont of Eucomonympha sp.]